MRNIKKVIKFLPLLLLIGIFISMTNAFAYEPWTTSQLIEPSILNRQLSNPKAPKIYIYSVGYQAIIKNSIDIGPGKDASSQKKLKQQVGKLPKDANIVIYCGCCPFERCPNIKPVYDMLNALGYKNTRILNLPHNIKVDWIDKGYAVKE